MKILILLFLLLTCGFTLDSVEAPVASADCGAGGD